MCPQPRYEPADLLSSYLGSICRISILGSLEAAAASPLAATGREASTDARATRPQPARPHRPTSRTQITDDPVHTSHTGSGRRERRAARQASPGTPR